MYPGASCSLLGERVDAAFYHGLDGLGDVPDATPPDESLLQDKPAALCIIEMARRYSGRYGT